MTNDERQELKDTLMQADLKLKQAQAFWETPRNLAILVGTVAAIAGVLGYKLGSQPPQTINVHLDAPLVTK
jgi:type II secretory pathway component PulM